MKTRFIQGLVMVALVVPFSGCPQAQQVSLGVWVFLLSDGNDIGVELLADGTVVPPNPIPPEANTSWSGLASWMQDRRTIMVTIEGAVDVLNLTGTVDTSTSIIDGTWETDVGGDSGTWTGTKL